MTLTRLEQDVLCKVAYKIVLAGKIQDFNDVDHIAKTAASIDNEVIEFMEKNAAAMQYIAGVIKQAGIMDSFRDYGRKAIAPLALATTIGGASIPINKSTVPAPIVHEAPSNTTTAIGSIADYLERTSRPKDMIQSEAQTWKEKGPDMNVVTKPYRDQIAAKQQEFKANEASRAGAINKAEGDRNAFKHEIGPGMAKADENMTVGMGGADPSYMRAQADNITKGKQDMAVKDKEVSDLRANATDASNKERAALSKTTTQNNERMNFLNRAYNQKGSRIK